MGRSAAALASLLLVASLPAAAQTASTQTLDRVFAYDASSVLNMAFGNANTSQAFTDTHIAGTNFVSCTLTAGGGLYCLDGSSIRNWPNPAQYAQSTTVLNCADSALGFDKGKGDPCTAMTVDQTGTIWLAAKKHNAHSIIKVVPKPINGCLDNTWVTLGGTSGTLCAKELYSGRPPVVDLIAIDGEVAANFVACPTCVKSGVIGMEERKSAVFYPDSLTAQPVTLVASGTWGLSGNELLQDIAVLQLPGTTYAVETNLLATTTTGRILAKNINQALPVRPVFNIPAKRAAGSVPCPPPPAKLPAPQYGVRASPTTDAVYVSDSNYCQVRALHANNGTASFAELTDVNPSPNPPDLTLSTVVNPVPPLPYKRYFSVIGLTIAPGSTIDLTTCTTDTGCAIINGQDHLAAATLSKVQLAPNSLSGATVFQIKGLPDCRYAAAATFPAEKRTVCHDKADVVIAPNGASVPVNSDGTLQMGALPPEMRFPSAMRLNVTPLLPADVVNAFNSSGLRTDGLLPPLLVSRQYRAQSVSNYIFEAVFVLPQKGVKYVNTFEADFEVPRLEGDTTNLPCPRDDTNLLNWGIATYVSEVYATEVPTSGPVTYVDTLANIGCGTVKIGASKLSLLPYDMEIAPDTWGVKFGPTNPVGETKANDAVFARLLQSLYADLGQVQTNFACTIADLPANTPPQQKQPPITSSLCTSLTSTWANGKAKIDKCIEAVFQPKGSASNENCQAFVSQLTNYRTALPAANPTDIANRIGELKVRIAVIFNLYYDRFVPSIPAVGGFCKETTCPAP
jgi:hypothetical protein